MHKTKVEYPTECETVTIHCSGTAKTYRIEKDSTEHQYGDENNKSEHVLVNHREIKNKTPPTMIAPSQRVFLVVKAM